MTDYDHENLLREFIEVTQLQSDIPLAESLLTSVEWRLEEAVALYFDRGSADRAPPPPRIETRQGQYNMPMSLMEELNQDLVTEQAPRPPPEPTSRDIPSESILAALLRPMYIGAKMVNGLFCLFSWIFPFLPRLIGFNLPRVDQEAVDPKQRAFRHSQWFKDSFSAREVEFFEGGYLDALAKAKEELRYLVLIITSADHVDMAPFAHVVSDPKFVDYAASKNIIIWAGSVKDSEGYQLANGLEVTSFPFLGLIAPSPKTSQSNTVVMATLLKKNGYDGFTPDSLIRTFDELLEEHGPQLLALELDRRQRDSARELRNEQDAAYERSLEQDRARQAEIERVHAASQEELRRRHSEETARALYLENLDKWKSGKALVFLQEPSAEGSTRVSIRLASGERVIRRFKATDTVRTIYEYVLSHGASPSPEVVENFEPTFDFCLVSPMPRKVIDLTDDRLDSVAAIWPNGTLVVDEVES